MAGKKGGKHTALVIVESPTKARTIKGFLPPGFVVEASVGHIRDLPTSAKEIPADIKDQAWSRVGINVEDDFKPCYVIPAEKKKQVAKLRALLKDADVLYLATDEDREGESISWHLVEVLKPKVPQKRLVFHEITKTAIQAALDEPRELDTRLVEAQEARRILDRLYGYEVSPILWRKVGPRLSAGRVQSVAVRLIVIRERERMAFVASNYWDLQATLATQDGGTFEAPLVELEGQRIASGKDFDENTGLLKDTSKALHLTEDRARELAGSLAGEEARVKQVERKAFTNRPSPPFTTSTLQQEANRKLRLTARATMQAAQRLYENGLITYMRTDSTTLSQEAISQARGEITRLYGEEYLSPEPRQFKTKVKNAQEAHEAIRPSGDFRQPDDVRHQVGGVEARVYELIWKRTMACQMAECRGHRTTVRIQAGSALFQTSGKTIEFPGFLRAYVEGADDPSAELADKEVVLPSMQEGDRLDLTNLDPRGHTTQPPARYTEASLVKELEAKGIGRPSTYASILDTIQGRAYVNKVGNALVPTFTAFAVVQLLERHFGDLVDMRFTARMEDDLDRISLGEMQAVPYLRSFYFGNGSPGLQDLLKTEIDARESHTVVIGKDGDGVDVSVRIGRYGPYLERNEDRGPIPEDLAPDELTVPRALELLAEAELGPRELGRDPETGRPIYARNGRFGPYVQLGSADDDEKPKMKSLFPTMVLEEIDLETALQLLGLPRVIGKDPGTDEEITCDYGRYGPYLRRGKDTRTLPQPSDVFHFTMEQALELLAQEKKGGRQRGITTLREVGQSPDTEEVIKVNDGRFGPYLTDGTTNVSVPRGVKPEDVTLEQAVELLRNKAALGPPKRKKKKAKKKAAKKKTTKKKTTKKKTTKKATKKKTAKKKVAKKDPGGSTAEG